MLTKIAREHALPFDPFIPNKTTVAAMKEARAGGLKRFDSVEALMADLHAALQASLRRLRIPQIKRHSRPDLASALKQQFDFKLRLVKRSFAAFIQRQAALETVHALV